jgi:hypothetical protein
MYAADVVKPALQKVHNMYVISMVIGQWYIYVRLEKIAAACEEPARN